MSEHTTRGRNETLGLHWMLQVHQEWHYSEEEHLRLHVQVEIQTEEPGTARVGFKSVGREDPQLRWVGTWK